MNPVLQVLAALYGRVAAMRAEAYRRGWLKSRRLNQPVISVGNLTTGGTGKTPLAASIAKLLLARGFKPSILTRGYRRRRGPSLLALAPASGRAPDPRQTGDEPALLAAVLPEVPIVICADRYRAGKYAEEHFGVNVHLLDDGFQHLQLARDLDIVALDATQEIADQAILPAGRQREPATALKRAQIIVLTRSDLASPAKVAQLESQVLEIHPGIPIFRSVTKLCGFVGIRTGSRLPPDALEGRRVYAFCGVGNPGAFFTSLRRWGMAVAGEQIFADHHVYTDREVAHLVLNASARGSARLVTTEKDAANIPPSWKADLNAFACVIEAEMDDPEAFEQALVTRLLH
ncbi:MAG TPA: tetraacyldisaccharide 4'-kinase [Terriglobia bacterium]|nr:tetraacyldisaccharide 4'-kinase [Terriglobia bacterium]